MRVCIHTCVWTHVYVQPHNTYACMYMHIHKVTICVGNPALATTHQNHLPLVKHLIAISNHHAILFFPRLKREKWAAWWQAVFWVGLIYRGRACATRRGGTPYPHTLSPSSLVFICMACFFWPLTSFSQRGGDTCLSFHLYFNIPSRNFFPSWKIRKYLSHFTCFRLLCCARHVAM